MRSLTFAGKDEIEWRDFKPEQVTAETANWDEAAEAVAGHRGKLVISR